VRGIGELGFSERGACPNSVMPSPGLGIATSATLAEGQRRRSCRFPRPGRFRFGPQVKRPKHAHRGIAQLKGIPASAAAEHGGAIGVSKGARWWANMALSKRGLGGETGFGYFGRDLCQNALAARPGIAGDLADRTRWRR